MRRIFTLGLCVLYLSFGSVAGLAHVHGTTGHHDASRGLHLGHAHLGHADDHDHDHGHGHHLEGQAHAGSHPFDHHESDAATLSSSALRANLKVRVIPALASIGFEFDRPSSTREVESDGPERTREPPEEAPPRPRGPPA